MTRPNDRQIGRAILRHRLRQAAPAAAIGALTLALFAGVVIGPPGRAEHAWGTVVQTATLTVDTGAAVQVTVQVGTETYLTRMNAGLLTLPRGARVCVALRGSWFGGPRATLRPDEVCTRPDG